MGNISKKWTKENCRLEALKFTTKNDFRLQSKVAYEKIRRKGWYDELCGHLELKIKPKGYWNEGTARLHAKECKSRHEFLVKYDSGYRIASKLGILDELFGENTSKEANYWIEDTIYEVSKEVSSRKELFKKYPGAYNAAHKLGIMNLLFEKKTGKNNLFWSKDKVLELLPHKYTKSKFDKEFPGASNYARRTGLWEELSFKESGSRYKRCIYSIEFSDKSVYIGLTYNFNERIYDHFDGKNKHSSARNHILKNPDLTYECIQLSEYIDIQDAQLEESNILNIYKKDGWNILNKAKTGGTGGSSSKWNKSLVLKLAKKYKRATDFEKSEDRGAYRYASKKGFVKELKYKD